MQIQTKVLIVPGAASLGLIAVAVGIGVVSSSMNRHIDDLEKRLVPRVELSREAEALLIELERTYQEAAAAEELEQLAAATPLRDQLVANLERQLTLDPEHRAALGDLSRDARDYAAQAGAAAEAMIAKKTLPSERLQALTSLKQRLGAALAEQTSRTRNDLAAGFEQMRELRKGAATGMGSIAFFFVALLGGISWWVVTQVARPLAELTGAAARIAEGDLTRPITIERSDEIGRLAEAFRLLVARLREVPVLLRGSVTGLAGVVSEIHSATQEQEAASTHQSSAMEEVSRTMTSLLDSAVHISDSAQGVLSNAERTKEMATLTATRITEFNKHTSRMAELLDAIREIADRTDLLALNASLEGTRAGEAGRGFALVAAEMRRLSERVAAQVHDVKRLVADVKDASASTMLVTEESQKLALGTAASARQITLVTQQQRTATEQVSQNMKDVASVLIQAVASIRETRLTAEKLQGETQRLTSLVERFRIDEARS